MVNAVCFVLNGIGALLNGPLSRWSMNHQNRVLRGAERSALRKQARRLRT